MKKTVLLMLAFSLAASLVYAQSEEQVEDEVNLGASQTRRPIAGFTVLFPADAKISTDGKTTQIEDIYMYVGRKFKAVEARLKKIEAAQEDLKGKVEYIDKRLTDAEKIMLASNEAIKVTTENPLPEKQAP